jgi:predicted esterase
MTRSPDGAVLTRLSRASSAATVLVLVLHGGNADSFSLTRGRDLAVLRLRPVAKVIARKVLAAAVYRLRFSIRGWNGDGAGALRDARWAVARMREDHPRVPIVLLGHSMGARVALHLGREKGVAGVVLLAPWAPSDDPAEQLAGKSVVIVQGGRDRTVPESTTRAWIIRAELADARITATMLPWAGHTMLLRFWVWHRLAAEGVAIVLRGLALR